MEVGGHLLGAGSLLLLCTLSDSMQVINLSSKCFYSLSISLPLTFEAKSDFDEGSRKGKGEKQLKV